MALEAAELQAGPADTALDGVEESPEAFVERWRSHAVDALLFPRPEGVPLVECQVGGTVIQVFDRTGPYLSRPGPARLIVNPTAHALVPAGPADLPRLEPVGLSRLAAVGTVSRREGQVVVVDAGVPLVVTVSEPLPEGIAVGALVAFESEAPVHGFVVAGARYAVHRRDGAEDHSW